MSAAKPKDSMNIVGNTKSHVGSQDMAGSARKKIGCYLCRKEGHVRRQCPQRRSKVSQGVDVRGGTTRYKVGSWSMGQTNKRSMICYVCREEGHIRTQCPQLRYVNTAGPGDRAMQRQLQLEYLDILRAKSNVHGVLSITPKSHTRVGRDRPRVATWEAGGNVDDGRKEAEVNEGVLITNPDVSLRRNVKVNDSTGQRMSVPSRPRGKG